MAKRKKRRPAARPQITNTNPVRPGIVSPTRTVPAEIPRPEYALTGIPTTPPPADVRKDAETIELLVAAAS